MSAVMIDTIDIKQVRRHMQDVMRDVGVVVDGENNFEVRSHDDQNLGVGVHIDRSSDLSSDIPVVVRIIAEWNDAQQLERAADMPQTHQEITVVIPHDPVSFTCTLERIRGGWQHGQPYLARWRPEEPLTEELMRKCVSFARALFERAL